jgi:hypothetical protein
MRRLCPLSLSVLLLLPVQAASQQIWFSPLDDLDRQVAVEHGHFPANAIGPTDYMALFAPKAPWAQAAGRIAVFKILYKVPLSYGKTVDTQFPQIFSFLKQHHIDLAIEYGPLTPAGNCGGGEGFDGAAWSRPAQGVVEWISKNGGELKYLLMDEPFFFGSIWNGPHACHWSAQQVATNALTTLHIFKKAFPGLVVGDAEVVPASGLAPDWLRRYADWMDAFQAATGTKLAFFHADTNRNIPTWMSDLVALQREVSKRGISFGIIYDGLQNESSDRDWLIHAEQFYTEFELSHGRPDQVIFQSWNPYPRRSLPETTPYTFTWLIDRYTRPRSKLSLSVASGQASGRLVDSEGRAVASAPITLSLEATSGPGVVSSYTSTGTVPPAASQAVVQICVNRCGSPGANNMSVYSLQYADSTNRRSLGFAQGLAGWNIAAGSTASVQAGSDAEGKFLHVSAAAAQEAVMTSLTFTVAPGSTYTFTVKARIPPDSFKSEYFAVIFLRDGKEVSRGTLPLNPGAVTLGTAQTGPAGWYSFRLPPQNPAPGVFRLRAEYAGTDALWPALAIAEVKR